MLRIFAACFVLIAPWHAFSAGAEEPAAVSYVAHEPHIEAHLFSADAVHFLKKLKQFEEQDPGFNKIVFKLEGFPTHQDIILETKYLTDSTHTYHPLMTFTILEDGFYLTSDHLRQGYIVSSSRGILPGERVYYRFHTADGSVDKEVAGIPNPIALHDKEGNVTLQAEIVSVSPTAYVIEMPMMQEGEEYRLKTVTVGAIVTAKPKYSSKHPLHFSPSAKSRGGVSTIEVRRKSGETYCLKLPWGTALDAYRNR